MQPRTALQLHAERDESESHTRTLLGVVAGIMEKNGVGVEHVHVPSSDVVPGIWSDTTEHGYGCTIPPQADCGWIGEPGPGPSYGDVLRDGTRAGFGNDFTQRNTTIMTWNLMHMAKLLRAADGLPNVGNDRRAWEAGCRFDYENPDYGA